MATCPIKVRKRATQELVACGSLANYVVTIEGKTPFRCCATHRMKYSGRVGVEIAHKILKEGDVDTVPRCDDPPPPPPLPEAEVQSAATTSTSTTASETTSSSGLHLVAPQPSEIIPPPKKKMTAPTTPAATPAAPTQKVTGNRVEVIDKMLHPIYSAMFESACNMRIRQKASTKYSDTDTEKVLALKSLKVDEVEKAIKQGKDAKKALNGEKALGELNGTIPKTKKKKMEEALPPPLQLPPPTQPMQPVQLVQPMQPMQPMMSMAPQMVVPTHFAPIPMGPFIDAPPLPILVGANGAAAPPDSEPIPTLERPLQPPDAAPAGGMVADANGVLRFQPGGMQANGTQPQQPQQPEKLTGNALLMAARQNRGGILGFFTLIENLVGAFGFPGAVGTSRRLAQDPSFIQCLTELLDEGPDVVGNGPLSFMEMKEGDHGMVKALKLYGGHLANNVLNYGTGKATMALSGAVTANAQASIDSVTPSPMEDQPTEEVEVESGPSDETNEMLPREEAPVERSAGDQMFLMPSNPSSYSVTPVGVVPVEPLYEKRLPTEKPPTEKPPTEAETSSLAKSD